MHRIDTPGNQAGQFVPPNVLTGQQPVKVDSAWLNDVQETLAHPIESTGGILQKGVFHQLTDAINALIGSAVTALKAAANTWAQLQTFNAGLTVTAGVVTLAADPTSAMQAATKRYVDSVAQGIVAKPAVQAATTANIALSGTQTIDGYAAQVGDRILVKNQSSAAQNGIYVVAAGAWSLAADFNIWSEVPGAYVFVEGGATNAHASWVCSAPASGTLGTTAISFIQFAYAGAYSADGTSLALTGSVFSIANGGVTAAKMGAGAAVGNIGYTPVNPASLGAMAFSNGATLNVQVSSTPGAFAFNIPANALPVGLGIATGGGGGAGYSGSGRCGGGGGAGGTAMGPINITPGGTVSGFVGGGGGGGSSGGSDGSGGGGTTLGPLQGNGGGGGAYNGSVAGGQGGTASGGGVNLEGGYGVDGSTTTNVTPWACGGGSYWGGGLRAGNSNAVTGGAPGAGAGVAYAVNGGIGGTGISGYAVLYYWTR